MTLAEHRARAILDHPVIAERWFFPRYLAHPDPFWVRVDGARLACIKFDGGHPRTLLHFHGNGELAREWTGDFRRQVLQAGFNLVLAEYRGYGASTGEPALGQMLVDAVATADAAGSAERLYVYGRSIGSLFALEVAARRKVAGLVLESAIASIGDRLELDPGALGCTTEELDAAIALLLDHRAKLEAHQGDVLILHAEHDELVPVSNAETLAAWAGDRAKLVLFSEGGHNTIHARNALAIAAQLGALAR